MAASGVEPGDDEAEQLRGGRAARDTTAMNTNVASALAATRDPDRTARNSLRDRLCIMTALSLTGPLARPPISCWYYHVPSAATGIPGPKEARSRTEWDNAHRMEMGYADCGYRVDGGEVVECRGKPDSWYSRVPDEQT